MKNSTFIILFNLIFLVPNLYSQEEDSIELHLTIREMYTSKNFIHEYNRELAKVRKVYPMALKAKALIDQYEKDLEEIEKQRKKNKYSKEAHDQLKEQFSYSIRDLYISEGNLLMQLVHRETNMTVNQIIKKYRGSVQAAVYNGMGNVFEQDLDATYDPEGKNKMTEIVIQDILSGQVEFNPEMDALTKAEFKKTQEEYKARKKATKTRRRIVKREKKIQEREDRKKVRLEQKRNRRS